MQEIIIYGGIFFIITLILGFYWIKIAKKYNTGEQCDPKLYQHKQNTPTIGGIIILIPLWIFVILFPNSTYFFIMVFATLLFLAGLIDDIAKLKRKNNLGLTWTQKLILHFFFGIIFCSIFYLTVSKSVPYLIFNVFFFVFFVNAINISDGLDGLAIGNYILVLLFLIFAFIFYDNDLLLNFSVILISCSVAFLIFNYNPAKIFMGDAGASMLGALLAMLTILGKLKYFVFIASLFFILEGLSSPIQILSKKYLKRRIIPSSPLHRTFLLIGFSEKKVVFISWIFTIICVIIATGLMIYT